MVNAGIYTKYLHNMGYQLNVRGLSPVAKVSIWWTLCHRGFASSPILLVVAKLGVVASHPPGMLQAVRGADLTIFGPDRISQHHPVPCRASHTWSWAEHFDQTPWASALTGFFAFSYERKWLPESKASRNNCRLPRLRTCFRAAAMQRLA